MANASQGVYSPLPQSISDSDSDKENPVENVRQQYAGRKSQNGVHIKFDRSNSTNGYMIPGHMISLPKGKRNFSEMSSARKCCLLFSLAVCILTVVVFLWVLPCSESGTCPVRVSSWENQHEDVEFKGRINVINSVFKNSRNLALLFRRSLNIADSRSGAISILGSNGAVAWYIPQVKAPSELNCYLIDVNGDGANDCLMLGEMGLEAVDPVSGEIFWHVHRQSPDSDSITSLDFPIVVPDLNNDGVNEMVTTINGKTFHNKLVVVCGQTGVVLGNVELKHCLVVHGLKYESGGYVYLCKNVTYAKYFRISLTNLQNLVHNKSFDIVSKPIGYNSTAELKYELNSHRLIVNNTGICPDCRTSIILSDAGNDKQLWYLAHGNSYSMKPISFIFKSTKSNMSSLKGHINGFILKLWQWTNYKPRKKKQLRNSEALPGGMRYFPDNANATIQVNLISERVVLITFNESNVHVINVSLTEITQLCFPIDEELVCQPDLSNQDESLLISDLDDDGSQELVSYSSTFTRRDDNWRLVSNMKVIRLEAELPKLYEVAK